LPITSADIGIPEYGKSLPTIVMYMTAAQNIENKFALKQPSLSDTAGVKAVWKKR